MNKKSFALSWGRKMFFGLGCALTAVVSLNYFQSMIIPQTFVGWIYYLTTYIGQYGLMISVVYFLMYCPVVLILPSYYISRVWSIFLILLLNLFIFFDSYLFTRYRFHLNSFLWDFLPDRKALTAFGLTPFKLGLIGSVALILFFVLWIRGERLWRTMQSRFRNPVQNWYLVLIVICFITSQLLYMYGDAKGARYITRLLNLFPVNYSLNARETIKQHDLVSKPLMDQNQGYKDFYYPAENLKCPVKHPKNIVFIVIDKWLESDLNKDLMPNIAHYASHGPVFNNHYSGGLEMNDGYFSLLYSLPPTYSASVLNQSTEPVFFSQMKKNHFDISFYNTGSPSPLIKYLPKEKEVSADEIGDHLNKRDELTMVNPFFMQLFVEGGSITEKDSKIKAVIELLIHHQQIKNTIIIITGASSDQVKTPLVVIWPDKKHAIISKLTSHYDVFPSIMLEDWKCKNRASDLSFGKNMFSKDVSEVHVAGNYNNLKIVDAKAQTITSISYYEGVAVRSLGSMTLENDKRDIVNIMAVLKDLTTFYKHR